MLCKRKKYFLIRRCFYLALCITFVILNFFPAKFDSFARKPGDHYFLRLLLFDCAKRRPHHLGLEYEWSGGEWSHACLPLLGA